MLERRLHADALSSRPLVMATDGIATVLAVYTMVPGAGRRGDVAL